MTPQASFGALVPGKPCHERPGAYAIIFNEKGEVAMVHSCFGYYLPGGALEGEESHTACIVRECMEEIAAVVAVQEYVTCADMYLYFAPSDVNVHGVGYFYMADLLELTDAPSEEEHELVWLSAEECSEKILYAHQAWAVEQVLRQRAGSQ